MGLLGADVFHAAAAPGLSLGRRLAAFIFTGCFREPEQGPDPYSAGRTGATEPIESENAMATPVIVAPVKKASWLSKIGHGFLKVFDVLASPQVQKDIQAGEAIGALIYPPLGPINTLINGWLGAIVATEQKAAAAAALGANATNEQKAAAAIDAVLPQIPAVEKQLNVTISPTSQKIINDALVVILNALEPAPTPVA